MLVIDQQCDLLWLQQKEAFEMTGLRMGRKSHNEVSHVDALTDRRLLIAGRSEKRLHLSGQRR